MWNFKYIIFVMSGILLLISCQNKNELKEAEVYHFIAICMDDYYQNYGVDIFEELNTFEKHLIKEAKLRDSSGSSYRHLLKSLNKTGYFQGNLGFNDFKNELLLQNPTNIMECAHNTFNIDSTIVSNSKMGQITESIKQKLENDEDVSIEYFFKTYAEELTDEEIEMPYIRETIQLFLYRWYYKSRQDFLNGNP